MKHLKLFALVLLLNNFNGIQAQDCPTFQDTIYNCGFEWQLDTVFQDINWQLECESDKWVAISQLDTSILFQFSDCGFYTIIFDHPECETDTFVLAITDESSSNYWSQGDNDFGYSGVSCPSGGSDCSNSVTISGGAYSNPSWSICQTLECSTIEVESTVYITDSTNCIVDSIQYTVLTESGSSSACWEGDQAAFINIDPNTGMIENTFFEFIDSLSAELLLLGLCPFIQQECASIPCEVDSVTIDTFFKEFPVHLGGQWTLIENQDTILLDSLTGFEKNGKDLVLEILPHPKYFGPGNITFNLFEINGQGDTIVTSDFINLTVFWLEEFVIDSIESYSYDYHYADSTCVGCGGNSIEFDFGAIPGIPSFPCGPVSIGFGDPCACSPGDIFVFGQDLITCSSPCADLTVEYSGIDAAAFEWTNDFGNSVGSSQTITTCESGWFNCFVTTINGCEYQTGIFVQENFEVIEPILDDVYLLDCETNCVTISTNLENEPNAFAVFTFPDGQSIASHSAEVCMTGTVTIEVENLLNGCIWLSTVSVEEKPSPSLTILPSFTIHCSPEVSLQLDGDQTGIASYAWTGPGITGDNFQNASPEVTIKGQYSVLITNTSGCTLTLDTKVDQIEILEFRHESTDACFESNTGSITIEILAGGIGPFMFNFDDEEWQESSELLGLSGGDHTIRILNADGCVAQQVVNINEIERILVDESLLESNYDLCNEIAVNIDLGPYIFDGVTTVWEDESTDIVKSLNEKGIYSVTLTSECEEVSIDFDINDTRLDEDRLIYIPTAFSPNEDGVNDEFLLSTPHQLESYDIAIYDRWGSKVFESNDLTKSWTGKVLNQGGLNGSYSYLLTAEVESCSDEIILVSRAGSITVLK